MGIDLLRASDGFQFWLFVPLLPFGLRVAGRCVLFTEHLHDGWPSVPCVPELGLLTKADRDNRFPLLKEMEPFWNVFRAGKEKGRLLEFRAVAEDREKAPLRGVLQELIREYRSRRERTNAKAATEQVRVLDLTAYSGTRAS